MLSIDAMGVSKFRWVLVDHWINSMIVLVKNLYTVHILIWLIQMRNPHHLWWRSKACSDIARRSTYVQICTMLWRRAALRTHSLSMPECAFWAGPQTPPPNNYTPTPTTSPKPYYYPPPPTNIHIKCETSAENH